MRIGTAFPVLLFIVLTGYALPSMAAPLPADRHAAVILAYDATGDSDASMDMGSFRENMRELVSSNARVAPLPDIVAALKSGQSLPDRTVAITLDGQDEDTLADAIPILQSRNFPFTIFLSGPSNEISTDRWNDLKKIKETGLASFGILGPATRDPKDFKRALNNMRSDIRQRLGVEPTLFAYRDGGYDDAVKRILKNAGIRACLGRQSGPAYGGGDLMSLPRFLQDDESDRFAATLSALPLPARDVSPSGTYLTDAAMPAIGFTLPAALIPSMKKLSCFASGFGGKKTRPRMETIENRVELRFTGAYTGERLQVNCTLPEKNIGEDESRLRWFGMRFLPAPEKETVAPENGGLAD